MSPLNKRKYRFLDNSAASRAELVADPAPLDGLFPLLPPKFNPVEGQPPLDDGVPPTAVGAEVMRWWGAAHGKPPEECPTGLVRAIEFVAPYSGNVETIRAAYRGSGSNATAKWRRNHAGRFTTAVELEGLVPAIGPATVQPRGNATYGRLLRTNHGLPIIHEIGEGLTITGTSAEHLALIREAQSATLKPDDYSTPRKDFVDSLALEGIKEEVRTVAFDVQVVPDGRREPSERGIHVETTDGWTRIMVAKALMSRLLNGLQVDVSRLHWHHDGAHAVRDVTAHDIVEAFDLLRFEEAPFKVWPQRETSAGVDRWLHDLPQEAKAVIRLMTCRLAVTLAVEPTGSHTDHNVIYADMSRFHVKGHQPDPWKRSDAEAFAARFLVSELNREQFIDDGECDVMLGITEAPWQDDPDRAPYRNRVVATLDTMVQLTVEDPAIPERYPAVRQTMKSMQLPNSPHRAATAAASLAVMVAGLEQTSEVGAFSAMMARSFKHSQVRRLRTHDGDWTSRYDRDVDVVADAARAELDEVLGTAAHAERLGENQRALALLAMAAHGMNPKLIDYRLPDGEDRDGNPRTIRHPSSMTISGRGGRAGPGTAVDAHVIVYNMARSPRGIDLLEAIVRAVTDHETPVLPVDPEHPECELLEDALRRDWAKTPSRDGEARPVGEESQGDDDDEQTTGGEELDRLAHLPELSTDAGFARAVGATREELRYLAAKVAVLADVTAGPEVCDVDPEDWDPDDPDLPRMLHEVGIDDDTAQEYDVDVETVRRFFLDGERAFFKRLRS